MKKLAFLIPSIGIGGGAERTIVNLINSLSNKYEICLIVLFEKKQSYKLDNVKIININIKPRMGIGKLITYIERSKKINNIIKEYSFDFLISFGETANILNLLTRNYGYKKIASVRNHPSSHNINGIGIIYNFIMKNFYSKFDYIVTLSKNVENDLHTNYTIPCSKITTIYNLIDIEQAKKMCNESIEENDFFSNNKVIINIGRFVDCKGQWHLIKILHKLIKTEPNLRLLLIGKGPNKKKCIKLAEKLKVEKYILFIDNTKNVFKYLNKSFLYVHVASSEGFGNVIIEAMASGIPVIASKSHGGVSEILCDDYTSKKKLSQVNYCKYGILTPALTSNYSEKYEINENLLEKEMLNIINNSESYKKYKEQSMNRVEYFDVKKIVFEWEKILNI